MAHELTLKWCLIAGVQPTMKSDILNERNGELLTISASEGPVWSSYLLNTNGWTLKKHGWKRSFLSTIGILGVRPSVVAGAASQSHLFHKRFCFTGFNSNKEFLQQRLHWFVQPGDGFSKIETLSLKKKNVN